MNAFEKAIAFVLSEEGGYVNDSSDMGGETNYGISKRAYPSLDIANLSKDQAAIIYRRDYWDSCKCDQLPEFLAIMTFDAAVNMGTYAAIKQLQSALNVHVDGIIGPMTINTAATASKDQVTELAARRMVAYGNMAQFGRYGLGWSRRLMKVYQLALEV